MDADAKPTESKGRKGERRARREFYCKVSPAFPDKYTFKQSGRTHTSRMISFVVPVVATKQYHIGKAINQVTKRSIFQEVNKMNPTKTAVLLLVIFALLAVPFAAARADGKATPEEVYELILKAVPVIESLGEEGLEAFKDPQGEFVYKDTYVLVLDCEKMVLAAHPNNKLIGLDLTKNQDKNPDPAKRKNHDKEICSTGKNPNGGWTEYYWEKLGETKPSRKVSFSIQVAGTPYTLVAGIYDDSTSVEELNKMAQ